MAEHVFVSAGRLRLVSLVRSITLQLGAAAAARRPLPAAGRISCPLAIQAAVLVDRSWLIPVIAAVAWWWLPADSALDLMAVVGAGICGAFWAAIGLGLLGILPDHIVVVGSLWASMPLALLGVGRWLRHRRGGFGGKA